MKNSIFKKLLISLIIMTSGTIQCDFWDFVGYRKGVQEIKTKYVAPTVRKVETALDKAKREADELIVKIKKGIATAKEIEAEYYRLIREYQKFVSQVAPLKQAYEKSISTVKDPAVKKNLERIISNIKKNVSLKRAELKKELKKLGKGIPANLPVPEGF